MTPSKETILDAPNSVREFGKAVEKQGNPDPAGGSAPATLESDLAGSSETENAHSFRLSSSMTGYNSRASTPGSRYGGRGP